MGRRQQAIIGSAILGATAGAVLFAFILAHSYYPPLWCGFGAHGWTCWLSGFWIRLAMCSGFGAAGGAASTYLRIMVR